MDEEHLPILGSALKRGDTRADIRYALANRLIRFDQQGTHLVRMWVGPLPSGDLIEIGIADPELPTARVIHAMFAREKYLPKQRRTP